MFHGDLAGPNPWPRFAPAATEAGFLAVHAFPMRLRESVLGTLNLFMAGRGLLSDADVARAFADAATIALLQAKSASDSRELAAQLQGALNSRIVIEQAKGTLAERDGIGMDEAFDRLRSFARTHNRKLADIARAVIAHTLTDAEMETLVRTGRTSD